MIHPDKSLRDAEKTGVCSRYLLLLLLLLINTPQIGAAIQVINVCYSD